MHIFSSGLFTTELILKWIYLDLLRFNSNKLLSNQSLISLITLFAFIFKDSVLLLWINIAVSSA